MEPIWINTIGAMIPIALAIVGSHFRLSNKITKVETELMSYKRKVDLLEEQSEKHHDELFQQIGAVTKSIQGLEKTILETSLRRENDYERLRELITGLTASLNSQDARILNIEYALYETTPTPPRKTRRKDN